MEYQTSKPEGTLTFGRIIELFGVISLGYLFFIVTFSQAGFLLNYSLTIYTLPISFAVYFILLCASVVFSKILRENKLAYFSAIVLFVIVIASMFIVGKTFFSKTYDTSWDGQGYHTSGIISLALGWNPVYEKELPMKFPDANIIVQGYPKALWVIQSSIYQTTGNLNAGKVTNLAILVIAAAFCFTFLRRLNIPTIASILVTTLLVFQPPFLMEFFSFMADGFSYQVALIAIASLGIFIIDKPGHMFLASFLVAELFLAGVKFSNLPLVAALGVVFLVVLVRKLVAGQTSLIKLYAPVLAVSGMLFLLTPYVTNTVFHGHMFFPSNLKEVSASYGSDNIPKNIQGQNRLVLLFYGIFSRSQLKSMGKDDPMNTAELKTPFTFTREELEKSSSIFNNRVGAAGPLFSGIMVLGILIGSAMCFSKSQDNHTKKYVLLSLAGITAAFVLIALSSPVPNLLRYNTQIVLIPFVLIVAAFAWFRRSFIVQTLAFGAIICIIANTYLYSSAVWQTRHKEFRDIDEQLKAMKQSPRTIAIRANNFYSHYIRLDEHQIAYEMTPALSCSQPEVLLGSSYTTKYCQK